MPPFDVIYQKAGLIGTAICLDQEFMATIVCNSYYAFCASLEVQ